MEKFKQAIRYYHTLKYLKASQIAWRLIRKFHKPQISLKLNTLKVAQYNHEHWMQSILRGKPCFLGDEIELLSEKLKVNDDIWHLSKSKDKLWRYNLHYFECLLSQDASNIAKGLQLFESWLRMCRPYSEDAWEPYPISLRIVNMIKCQLNNPGKLSAGMLESLYLQARYLFKIPEYHLLGNHLFENAKALFFAGVFFEGREADKWRRLGWKLLEQQISEQILEDGGHFELSPMYHVIILEGLLDLYNLCQYTQHSWPEAWSEAIQKMRYWLKAMQHPDGEISFFNDAALGVAVSPQLIEAYANHLGLPVAAPVLEGITYLPSSGYVRLQKGEAVILIDCARVGPNYLPGHAHADTLSFEFSLGKQRVFVNSGTSSYQDLILRAHQRSTAAHNTVVFNGMNSSEVWGAFRVGKRAFPVDFKSNEDAGKLSISCSHGGYNQGKNKCIHNREWILSETSLHVKDSLRGDSQSSAVANYYFSSGINLQDVEKDQYGLALEGRKAHCTFLKASSHASKKSQYYPAFNKAEDTTSIEALFNNQIEMKLIWGSKQ
jgi:uncharacterized heparinase superfamily protein